MCFPSGTHLFTPSISYWCICLSACTGKPHSSIVPLFFPALHLLISEKLWGVPSSFLSCVSLASQQKSFSHGTVSLIPRGPLKFSKCSWFASVWKDLCLLSKKINRQFLLLVLFLWRKMRKLLEHFCKAGMIFSGHLSLVLGGLSNRVSFSSLPAMWSGQRGISLAQRDYNNWGDRWSL